LKHDTDSVICKKIYKVYWLSLVFLFNNLIQTKSVITYRLIIFFIIVVDMTQWY